MTGKLRQVCQLPHTVKGIHVGAYKAGDIHFFISGQSQCDFGVEFIKTVNIKVYGCTAQLLESINGFLERFGKFTGTAEDGEGLPCILSV